MLYIFGTSRQGSNRLAGGANSRPAWLDLPVDPDLRRLNIRAAFMVDSTTIDLCLALFPWALFRNRKGAVKTHVMLDLGDDLSTQATRSAYADAL